MHDKPISLHDNPNNRVAFSVSGIAYTDNRIRPTEIRTSEDAKNPRKSLLIGLFPYLRPYFPVSKTPL